MIDRPSPPHVLTDDQLVGPGPEGLSWFGLEKGGCAVAAQRKGADTPSYLRAAEVADILHVSPKTVSRWAKEGKLPFMKTWVGTAATRRPRSGNLSTSSGWNRRPELADFLVPERGPQLAIRSAC